MKIIYLFIYHYLFIYLFKAFLTFDVIYFFVDLISAGQKRDSF